MERKREAAREAAAAARQASEEARRRQAAAEVIPYLRTLGFRADESRAAATLCEPIPEASLEQRVKVALSYFANRHCTRIKPGAAPA
jgi:Holliday junction resolvasome RuvABC DNA-binding subunit